MNKNVQRLSQLITTFGPGAMVDLPTRSVIVGGLEQWDMSGNGAFTLIAEQRLTSRLEQLLRSQGRLTAGSTLTLRTPPITTNSVNGIPRGVTTPVFPTWFVCERVETIPADGRVIRRRRLVPWQSLDTRGRRRFQFDDGKKSEVSPIRFVCACADGTFRISTGDGRFMVLRRAKSHCGWKRREQALIPQTPVLYAVAGSGCRFRTPSSQVVWECATVNAHGYWTGIRTAATSI